MLFKGLQPLEGGYFSNPRRPSSFELGLLYNGGAALPFGRSCQRHPFKVNDNRFCKGLYRMKVNLRESTNVSRLGFVGSAMIR